MKNLKKLTALGLAALLTVAAAGCGGDDEPAVVNKGTGEIPETLTIYCGISGYATKAGAKDMNDMLPFQMMEEFTGCHVEWIHPATGSEEEKFNLTIASGNLPDMMVSNWKGVQGGAKMYADDGVIIPLRELMEENMPNLTAYNAQKPHVAKQYIDDSGEVYYIPFIRKDEQLKVYQGPQIRQDWLEKLGLEAPTTPDELYNVLMAFKTQDPNGNGEADEIPMSGVKFENTSQAIGNLLWMFGTANGFYVENGQVKYGVQEDAFEEGLKYITKLYADGLIDKDYLLNDRDKMDNKFMNDKVGFVYSLQPGNYYKNMNDGTRKVTGIAHPKAEGVTNNVFDSSYTQDVTGISIAVTTANENPSGSLKWLDNFYGGKGLEIINFGKEGVSFEYDAQGNPKLTDYIFNNPNGKSQQEMSGLSLGTYQSNFPALQLWSYYEQILSPWGKESIETWAGSAGTDGVVPPLSFTEEENETIAQNMSQIETFVSERINKIVIGNGSIDELPEIREKIKSMGIDEVIEIYNNALKRYNER
ncbi:MAG: extracellular solute-binding protein [Clostridia bacterium]|nr:extracellular solute-binding protein [Clostridia bacterium]